MPKYGSSQTVQSQARSHGTNFVCRISGSGLDRYERRRVVDVENNVNRTFGKAGPCPITNAKLRRWGGKIDGPCRAARPSVFDFGVTPPTLIGRTLAPSRNIAGQPARRWPATNGPKVVG
jgi:hypothetical protein